MNTHTVRLICLSIGLVAGCSAPATVATTSGDAVQVVVKASEFKFDPSTIEVPAGRPVTLVLDNTQGGVEHDLECHALGIHLYAPVTKTDRQTYTFTADKAGDYACDCSLPGHKDSGMSGTIRVVAKQ